jgi:hypothetical protein
VGVSGSLIPHLFNYNAAEAVADKDDRAVLVFLHTKL